MMIKPVGFRYNEQTAVNNYYQQQVLHNLTPEQTQEKALKGAMGRIPNFIDFFLNFLVSGGPLQRRGADNSPRL